MNFQKGNSAVVIVVLVAAVLVGAAIYFLTGNGENEVVAPTTNQSETINDSDNSQTNESAENVEDMEALVIDIGGENFSFSQEEIRVQEGQEVTINFTSNEGIHDWVVDEFDAATNQVAAGETTSVTFVADRNGEFEYYCSVGDHRQMGMVGTLIVD